MEIRETQIEDILISSPALMKKTLKLEEEPRLIGRQIVVPSGRLDMLYAYQKFLFLIELKVAVFQRKFIEQVISYRNDLLSFQKQGKLVQCDIQPFLLLPEISNANRKIAETEGIHCEEYNPENVLKYFYSEKLRRNCLFSFARKDAKNQASLFIVSDYQFNCGDFFVLVDF